MIDLVSCFGFKIVNIRCLLLHGLICNLPTRSELQKNRIRTPSKSLHCLLLDSGVDVLNNAGTAVYVWVCVGIISRNIYLYLSIYVTIGLCIYLSMYPSVHIFISLLLMDPPHLLECSSLDRLLRHVLRGRTEVCNLFGLVKHTMGGSRVCKEGLGSRTPVCVCVGYVYAHAGVCVGVCACVCVYCGIYVYTYTHECMVCVVNI